MKFKKSDYQKAKARLDKYFSEYIRLRDSKDGICRCVTCGKLFFWKNGDCGHFISRKYLSLRWDEKNCGAQCKSCNLFNQGEQYKFVKAINTRWGDGTVAMLELKKHNLFKAGAFELNFLAGEYKK